MGVVIATKKAIEGTTVAGSRTHLREDRIVNPTIVASLEVVVALEKMIDATNIAVG